MKTMTIEQLRNAKPKFIAWLSDGSDCWNHQLLDSEELLSLRARAMEATGGNIEVHAYPLHAYDAMREALEEIIRNVEPWKTADNMAGRLYEIASNALPRAKTRARRSK